MAPDFIEDKLCSLLIESIPKIIEAHFEEMMAWDAFKMFIQDPNANYRDQLNTAFKSHFQALFLPDHLYHPFIRQSEKTGCDLGILFAGNPPFTIEFILHLTNSTRMCGLRQVLKVLDQFPELLHKSTLIERLYELANARQNAFLHGFIQKQNEKLRAESITDPLTGVYNRRFFYESIVGEMKKACQAGSPLTLMLIDLNNFKAVNDKWGHQEGDHVLKEFACFLADLHASVDRVFRFGGDEFVLLLPNCSEAQAGLIGSRLNTELMNMFPAVSLSYGTVSLPLVSQPERINIDHYLKIADDRMYSSKERYKRIV